MIHQTNQTIAAIATAPGVGAIGTIRLSGMDAIAITDKIFKGKKLADQASHTLHFGHIVAPSREEGKESEVIDEVVVSLFKTPKSYTGEDVVEISGHGSPFILNRILEMTLEAGARLALPGEFTQRAFLHGKMDLAQAEAVADLIAADSKAAQQTALKQLRGGFSNDLKSLREEMIHFAALIELELDFSEEDVEFADRAALLKLISRLNIRISNLLDSFQLGNVIKQGVRVAIIGKPNAGKSTLLNALLNEERAIVSDIAGTTRDTIEETLNINGILFRLIDTAGIREHSTDIIENLGIERSKQNADQAHLILHLMDATDDTDENTAWLKQYDEKTIMVFNKTDLIAPPSHSLPYLSISAKERKGIDPLKQEMYRKAIGDSVNTENTIITNARHHQALQKTLACLQDIDLAMQQNISGELLALDIRRCLHYLGEITGEVEVDRDILGTIFGKFCIGK
ncbi:MAG TPA: tRNA uridine-5-carboxymethylaminomethyl(34) synthesis GTPase MnmE [Flavipsychrobacter sp.]|nr:tRNA uridine-5-carboxymethylaminomethyl(34) synthesis GTPase MnmE [Flavipsychrobacter sp.]